MWDALELGTVRRAEQMRNTEYRCLMKDNDNIHMYLMTMINLWRLFSINFLSITFKHFTLYLALTTNTTLYYALIKDNTATCFDN
jgi:hypothetical protein